MHLKNIKYISIFFLKLRTIAELARQEVEIENVKIEAEKKWKWKGKNVKWKKYSDWYAMEAPKQKQMQ